MFCGHSCPNDGYTPSANHAIEREVLTASPACRFRILWFALGFVSADGLTKECQTRLTHTKAETRYGEWNHCNAPNRLVKISEENPIE